MKKFDLIFEKAMFSLREQEEYVDSTFEDNIRALVKTLKDNDFLPKTKDVEAQVKDIMAQPNNVKEIVLDTQENSLPAMKLRTKQDADSESFTVTAIELEKPDQQKTFENSMLETIFDDVVEYIKTAALQGLSPDNAVEELPQAEETLTQPGAEESALPQG
jgi:hypothetical protein